MRIRLIAVGKIREAYIAAAIADFRGRLRPYIQLEEVEIKAADGADPPAAMASEAERILRAIEPSELVWLLDPNGSEFTSEGLSAEFERMKLEGRSALTLVIAGTFGAGGALRARANFAWSLSRLTFLHEWARAIVLEQLYRAARIGRGEPYHH